MTGEICSESFRIGPVEWHAISSAACHRTTGGREYSTKKEIIAGEVGQIKSSSKTRRGGMDRKMINYQLPTRTSAAPSPVGGYESVKDELAKLWPRGNSDYNNVLIIIMKTRQRGRFTPFGSDTGIVQFLK